MANPKEDSVQIAREYLDSLLVESRVIGAERPNSRFSFLGETFDTPIMTAALSHLNLDLDRTSQVATRDPKTPGGDLLNGRATVFFSALSRETLGAFAALARVRLTV